MKCKNKKIKVKGQIATEAKNKIAIIPHEFTCIVTNDEIGKTLSLDNGRGLLYTIPFEPLEKYLK